MSTNAVHGTLELNERGFGFLRSAKRNYAIHPTDVFVPVDVIRKYNLRGGEDIIGEGKPSNGGKNAKRGQIALAQIETITGLPADQYIGLTEFKNLTVIDPKERIQFETPNGPIPMRVIDLMTPIARGQRGLIAAPPRTGKTMLLQQMAAGLAANHPDIYMMVLLIDERPEEVTEMRRTVHGEVVSSSNDENVASHIRIARLMLEKSKRMVEAGQHVLILLDSLTRLGRAFNAGVRSSGRIMSGGIDINALAEPKAIFGAARNIENGGSLTILASALIDTGSRMDEVIFNEFKGTGNMEIMLTRELANLRIWPTMDINQSGTRKEELILGKETAEKVYRVRRQVANMDFVKAMEKLTEVLGKYEDNPAFLETINL
jgi:transcription termination factor Rho